MNLFKRNFEKRTFMPYAERHTAFIMSKAWAVAGLAMGGGETLSIGARKFGTFATRDYSPGCSESRRRTRWRSESAERSAWEEQHMK